MNKISNWKESAGNAFEQNEKYIRENNRRHFIVNVDSCQGNIKQMAQRALK